MRLGIETDLRAARAKLDTLLGTATAPTLLLDHAKGGDCDKTGRGDEREEEVGKPSPHDHNDGDVMHGEAGNKGDIELTRKIVHREEVGSPATRSVSSKKGEDSGPTASDDAGRGRGIGRQQSKGIVGRNRGTVNVKKNTPAAVYPSQHKRRSPVPEETTTARKPPQSKHKETHNSENVENTTKPTSTNRKEKAGLDPRHTASATEEQRPKKREKAQPQSVTNTTIRHNIAKDESKSVAVTMSDSLAEGELQEKGKVREHPCDADGTQALNGKEESLAADGFASAHSTMEKSRTKVGLESSPSKQDKNKASRNVAQTTSLVQENSATSRNSGRARSPRTSPLRAKGVPLSTAQLRRRPVSPRKEQTNDSSETGLSGTPRNTIRGQLGKFSHAAGESRPTENTQSLEASTTDKNEISRSSEGTVGETVTGTTASVPNAEAAGAAGRGERDRKDFSQKAVRGQMTTKPTSGQKTEGSSPGKVARAVTAQRPTSRSLAKAAKAKPALGGGPTRLGLTTKAKRASAGSCTDDATGAIAETLPPNPDIAAGRTGDALKPEKTEVDDSPGEELGGESTFINTTDKAIGEGIQEAGRTTAGRIRQDSSLEVDHELTAAFGQGAKAARNDGSGKGDAEEAGGGPTEDCGGGFIDALEQSANGHSAGDGHLLPSGVVHLAEALGVEVDRLRLEKAELEDTVAQLNVAAAQLYFVEYEQMKVCGGSRVVRAQEQSGVFGAKAVHGRCEIHPPLRGKHRSL